MQRRIESTSVIPPFFFAFAVVLVDQLSKFFAQTYSRYWQGTFLRITENDGIAFSIPLHGIFLWFVLLVFFVVLVFFVMSAIRTHDNRHLFSLLLIVAGGLSNTIDRIRFGAVVDIFFLPGGLLLNIADGAILIGILLFCARACVKERRM